MVKDDIACGCLNICPRHRITVGVTIPSAFDIEMPAGSPAVSSDIVSAVSSSTSDGMVRSNKSSCTAVRQLSYGAPRVEVLVDDSKSIVGSKNVPSTAILLGLTSFRF